jgi:integrase
MSRLSRVPPQESAHIFSQRALKADNLNIHHFKPTLKKAGLSENRRCRDTRGTFIINALVASETMGFVQNQVGHSSIKPIVNHYYNRIQRDEDGLKMEEALKST